MDFNALQQDLDAAAVTKKKNRRTSSVTTTNSGSAFRTERESPSITDAYVFVDQLGQGAYGSVMRARKRGKHNDGPPRNGEDCSSGLPGSFSSSAAPSTEPQYAVKIIDKKKAGSKGLSEVMGEVETMRLLNHPNIVRLEEIFETDDCLYIVMEYVPGGELHQVLKRTGPLPEPTVRQIIIQLLLAVEYIHQRGIVHRDLKPANMLLKDEQEWQIKLADFGFAVLVGTENCLTSYCGTGAYMAPEIVLDMNYGKAVDLWAVGVILYVIMSGDYPFHATGGQDVASAIVANKWQRTMHPRIAEASPGAKDFLSKLLTSDSNKRLTAKEALKHTWIQAALQGLTHRVEASAAGRSGELSVGSQHVVAAKTRFRSWVHVMVAMHRLVYWRKVRVLRLHHADVAPLKSFTYLVSGKYEPLHPRGVISVQGLFAHNPNKIIPTFLLPLVEGSSTIETLDLSENNIESVDTMQAIVKALMHHPSLVNLVLENNPIPSLAGRSLVRLARAPNKIRCIKLGGTLVGTDVLQQVTSILKDKKTSHGGQHHDTSGNNSSSSTLGAPHHVQLPTSPIPPATSNAGSSSALLPGGRHYSFGHTPPTAAPPSNTAGGQSSASPSSRSSSLVTVGSGSASHTSRGGVTHHSTVLLSTNLQHANPAQGSPRTETGSASSGKRTSLGGAHSTVSPTSHSAQNRGARFQTTTTSSSTSSSQQSKLPPIPASIGMARVTSPQPAIPRKR